MSTSAIRPFWRRGHASRPGPCIVPPVTPTISIVIAARNEAPALHARLQNLLTADYPADRLQIIVVSDGSTDETADILNRFAGRVDSVLLPPGRQGARSQRGGCVRRDTTSLCSPTRASSLPPMRCAHWWLPLPTPAWAGSRGSSFSTASRAPGTRRLAKAWARTGGTRNGCDATRA